MSAASELVEVVDADGSVLRVVTRAEMRAQRLRHRCTYVAVVDRQERLVVHQRAPWKDVWPSRWDLAFGGVAAVGEEWPAAAERELAEEAGVRAELEWLATGSYDDADVSLIGHVFLARHDGPVTFDDGEVVASDRVPLAEVDGWCRQHTTCPDSVALVGPALRSLVSGSPAIPLRRDVP